MKPGFPAVGAGAPQNTHTRTHGTGRTTHWPSTRHRHCCGHWSFSGGSPDASGQRGVRAASGDDTGHADQWEPSARTESRSRSAGARDVTTAEAEENKARKADDSSDARLRPLPPHRNPRWRVASRVGGCAGARGGRGCANLDEHCCPRSDRARAGGEVLPPTSQIPRWAASTPPLLFLYFSLFHLPS